MDNYEVIIDADALTDIKEAVDWYDKKVGNLGERFKQAVKLQISRLNRHPEIYSTRYKSVHYIVVKKFPFMIHFVIDDESCSVMSMR